MMVGDPTKHDTKFDMENYEEFYEHHNFEPIPEKLCTTVNEVIPVSGGLLTRLKNWKLKLSLILGVLMVRSHSQWDTNSDSPSLVLISHKKGLTLPKNELRLSTSELTSIRGLSKNGLPSSPKKDASLKS